MNDPFSSLEHFRDEFNQGLKKLIDKEQLGTFILCLANATNDSDLFEKLKQPLLKQYKYLLKQYQQALKSGQSIEAVEEDLLVFLKLHTLGFENIKLTQQRTENQWLCQFNQLRSFRPKRMTQFKHNGEMSTAFVEEGFHFNKPFMKKECFWAGCIDSKSIDIFYNKYPFSDLHTLIVPQRELGLPQFLTEDMHYYIFKLTKKLSANLPGLGVGYNSYGAYASVNHLHFQMFVHSQGLPVTHSRWKHNNGKYEYPLKVFVFDNIELSWKFINELHIKKQAYNLLYMPDKIFIIPRQVQGAVDAPQWSSGITWYELSGAMLLFNQKSYTDLSGDEITRILKEYNV